MRSFDGVHKDKIQSIQWNDKEPTVLLSGSYDRTVRTFDSRAPESCLGAVVGSDFEALRWDPWDPYGFYVSLENGLILNFDARTFPSGPNNPSPSRFTLSAHDNAASVLDINPHGRGMLVTGGTDKIANVTETPIDCSPLTHGVNRRVKYSQPPGRQMIPSLSRPEVVQGNSKFGTSGPTRTSGRCWVLIRLR
jgi:WD40 repeat protein